MRPFQHFSDQQLTVLISTGDQAAFAEVYDRYWAVLYVHAIKMLRDKDEAKDVLQELFVTLWSKSTDIQFSTSLKSYLYTAVRNKILDMIAHEKVKTNYAATMVRLANQKSSYVTDEQVQLNELKRIIDLEVARLPEKMRECFMLSRNQHLSYKEIAALLDISETTVRKQVQNAMRILKGRIDLPVALLLFYFYA